MDSNANAFQIKAVPKKVSELLALKREGLLHLPDLQRGFVWDSDRVRMLFDSLFRRYPVGSLLVWKPTWSGEAPVRVRPWDLSPADTATGVGVREQLGADDPREGSLFVLDGQQRLTALFSIVFLNRVVGKTARDPDLYVSLSDADEWKEAPFLYRNKQIGMKDEAKGLIVPAEVLFAAVREPNKPGAESRALNQAISKWLQPDTDEQYRAFDRANYIRNAILNAEIVAYEIDNDAKDDNVIEIFGRLNQQGMRLPPSDLAAARLTGKMGDFRKRASEALKRPEFDDFAVRDGEDAIRGGGFVDTDLLVRTAMCLAQGVIKYSDAEKTHANKAGGSGNASLYSSIEPCWNSAVEALCRTVSWLRSSGIPSGRWLPYRYLLLTPSVTNAGAEMAQNEWLAWVLCASIWGLYAGSAETKAQADARMVRKGDWPGLWKSLRTHAKRPDSLIPRPDDLQAGVVQTSGVLLALLVSFRRKQATSMLGHQFSATPAPRLHVHHIFSRKTLRTLQDATVKPDRIGNLTILVEAENESIGSREPVDYLRDVPDLQKNDHQLPADEDFWKVENFDLFCLERENRLAELIKQLLVDLGVNKFAPQQE